MTKPVYYKSFRSRSFYQLKMPTRKVLDVIEGNNNIILDIGFGTGESSIALRETFPNSTVCGIEAYKPGVKNLLDNNVFVHYGDALELLEKIKPDAISKVFMFFPDPWQKKKHRKRRLFNRFTFNIIRKILKQSGLFQITTDNINYAIESKNIIREVISKDISFSKTRGNRPITKFEKKAKARKNFIFDIIYLND